MIGDGPGDAGKNHMESSWIGHTEKGWVWILENQNFPFFGHEYHHEVLFSCLFYFTEPFSVSLEPQQVEGRRPRQRQRGRWGCQQIFQGRLEHMKYWRFKNRWFCCCGGVDATHEILKRGSGYTTLPREFFLSKISSRFHCLKTSKTCLWGEGMFDEEGLDTWTCFYHVP